MASIWSGADRRAWLDRQDEKLSKGLAYYLGPAAQPVSGLAKAMGIMSPGADMMDMATSGQDLMQAKDWRGAATAGAGLGAAMMGMAIPGTAKGVSDGAESVVRGYHGSKVPGLSTIKPQSTRGALGPGAYFTPLRNLAERYGSEVYEADLPGVFNGMGSAGVGSDVNHFKRWRDETAKLVEAAPPEQREKIKEIAGKYFSGDGYPLYVSIAQAFRDEGAAQELFRSAGFKGLSGVADGPEVVMFGPVSVAK